MNTQEIERSREFIQEDRSLQRHRVVGPQTLACGLLPLQNRSFQNTLVAAQANSVIPAKLREELLLR